MESKIKTKDAATKTRNKKCHPLPPRKSDGQLIVEQFEYTLLPDLQSIIERGARRITFVIDLPDAPENGGNYTAQYTLRPDVFARYAVVECNDMFSCERGRAETWEAACALLESLQGTQQRGWLLQINGLNANGLQSAENLLKYGIRRGY